MEEQQAINSEIIKNKIPDENTIDALANLFKMFGDSTRVKILSCLQVKSLYVYEIADILNMSSSAVSHQLRVLRSSKLVKGIKMGKEVLYSIDDDHVSKIMEYGLTHVNEGK